jgi:hypothetical protein
MAAAQRHQADEPVRQPMGHEACRISCGEDRRVLTVRNQATGDMSLADPDHAGRIGFVPARL